MSKKKLRQPKSCRRPKHKLKVFNTDCGGIDVGADEVYVALDPSKVEKNVKCFGTTTPDLREMATWLKECGITSIAMESTGVYWMPVYAILEEFGIETHLVDARKMHNVPGRKTDVCDAEWLQQLHSYGLFEKAVILPLDNRRLRTLLRLRETHVRSQGQAIQRMQKAMTEMNIRLDRVLTDITGVTGLAIVRSIIGGQHKPKNLVELRHGNCKHSEEDFVKALTGFYTPEHLLALEQHLEVYEFLNKKLKECEATIQNLLASIGPAKKVKAIDPFAPFSPPKENRIRTTDENLVRRLHELFGVDLTQLPGIGTQTVLTLVAEVGTDLRRWRSPKAFASWLGLCPHPKISGGRVLSSKSKRSANRASGALRMAASSLSRNDSYIGAFHNRMRFRKHKAAAVTATAHKLARLIWICVTEGTEYQEHGSIRFQNEQRNRKLRRLRCLAKDLEIKLPGQAA